MKIAGRRFETAWHECDRCGFQFPLTFFRRQNGILVCSGKFTNNCADNPGRDSYTKKIRFPKKEGVAEEPRGNEVAD